MTEFPDLARRFIAGSYHQILGSRILTSAPVLELKIISKRFLALQALDKVDFDLREGEIHALVGENGAGKSTLMRILSGVYTEYDGEYTLDGQPVHFRSPREARDRGIAMIHQELSVMPQLSVAEDLFLGQQKRSTVYISHVLDEVMRVADRVAGLRDGRKVNTLNRADTTVEQLVGLILGRAVSSTLPPAATTEHERVLLEVKSLTADVFSDVSLTIGQGEIVGIYGAVGAGHFDLARALFGMYRFDSGAIIVDGQQFPRGFSARYAIRDALADATESRRQTLSL